MTRNAQPTRLSFAVKLCIWSIRHQSWLAGQIRIYIYSGTALLALLALADVVTIQTAMLSSFCGGAVLLGLIWTLIQQRKAILLNIREPEVRDQAHRAMLAYLREVNPVETASVSDNELQSDYPEDCRNCNLP